MNSMSVVKRKSDGPSFPAPGSESIANEKDKENEWNPEASEAAEEAKTVVNLDHRRKTAREPEPVSPHMDTVMSDIPTRREIDAELRAAEARTETRISQLGATIEARSSASDHKIDLLIGKVEALSIVVSESKASTAMMVTEVKADSKETRKTVWIVGLASTLAILALVTAIWVAGINEQNNMIAIFQAGLGVRALPETALPTTPLGSSPQLPTPSGTPARK